MKDYALPWIVCWFCSLQSEERGIPTEGFSSVGAYVRHYGDQHMGIHGMVTVGDVRRQTLEWRNARLLENNRGAPLLFSGYLTYPRNSLAFGASLF